jgi:glycosyltransferase involved in cell wall biosynthesis
VLIRGKPNGPGKQLEPIRGMTVIDIPPARRAMLTNLISSAILYPWLLVAATWLAIRVGWKWRRKKFVVVAYDHIFSGLASHLAARQLNAPVVVCLRGAYGDLQGDRSTWTMRIVDTISRYTLGRADFVISKAEHLVKGHEKILGITIDDHVSIPTGLDFAVFDPQRVNLDQARAAWSAPESDIRRISYIGRITPEKGLIDLIEGFALVQTPRTHLLIAGLYGDAKFVESLRRRIRDLGIEDKVILKDDGIAYDLVPGVLAVSDCIVLLSKGHHEGVPRILQEAVAMGTPIVTSESPGILDAFGGFDGIHFVKSLAEQAIADSIDEALRSANRPSREEARKRFDIAANYASYVSLFKQRFDTGS